MKTTEPGIASNGIPVWGVNLVITGVAVSWGDRDAYFITLTSENIEGTLYKIMLSGSTVINGTLSMLRRSAYIL